MSEPNSGVRSINALTVDVEEYFQVSNFDDVLDRDRWPAMPSRVADSTTRLLDLFEACGHKATFFCLGWVAEREPALIRAIAERGHEVACHGFGHQLVYELGEQRFREDVHRAKAVLEDATGLAVTGYRAPSYSVTERSLWALDVLSSEGFRYDSSIFPIRHYRYGIPQFPREPVELELPSGARLREFPLTTVQLGPVRLPLAGGAYLRFFPVGLFRWGFGRLSVTGTPGVLYTHPWEIDPHQPRLDVGARVRVNHYYNLDRMETRLRSLLERFSFGRMDAVLDGLDAAGRLPRISLGDALRVEDQARAA